MTQLVSSPEFEYLGVYIPISEYMNYYRGKWPRKVVDQTITGILARTSRAGVLRGLGSLRSEIESDVKCEAALNDLCSTLDSNHSLILKEILKSDYPKRVLYTPQVIVQASNYVLSVETVDNDSSNEYVDRISALMLCHLMAEMNSLEGEDGRQIRFGSKEFDAAALSFLANHFFHANDDRLSELSRTRKLWKSKSVRACESLNGMTPEQIFEMTVGVPIDVRIAAALLLIGSISPGSGATASMKTRHEKWGAHLSSFTEKISWQIDNSVDKIEAPSSEWDMSTFVERPCISLSASELVIPGSALLVDRVTVGLLDEVETEMKTQNLPFNLLSAWGHVIEDYVRERLSPLLVSRGVREIVEDEFANVYKDYLKKRPDLILDFGEDVLVIDVMKSGLSASTIYSQDVSKFRRELDGRLFKKLGQLNNVISVIDAKPELLFPDGRQRRFIPIIVSSDRWGHNPFIATYIEERCKKMGLFRSNNSVSPICLDIGEVELCEALIEQDLELDDLLRSWIDSDLYRMPFKNFFLKNFPTSRYRLRSSSLEEEFSQSINEILREFGWIGE